VTEVSREAAVMTEDPKRRVDLRQHAEEIAQAGARAPSHHNAQPWAFRVLAGAVEIHADRSRRLPAADPEDRQLFLGVGAAVYGVRLALAVLGLQPVVQLDRDDARPDLAATVMASGQADPAQAAEPAEADPTEAAEAARRYAELSRRQTVRGPFTDDPLPGPLQEELTREVDQEGAALYWAESEESRRDLAALVAAADREQRANLDLRAELVRSVGPAAVRRRAGIPFTSLGRAAAPGGADVGFQMRDFSAGDPDLGAPTHRAEAHPGIAVLQTHTDERADWLRGGQAMHRLLLAASTAGFQASFLNQPLEVPRLREELRRALGLAGHPQLVLRLGLPRDPLPPPTPRLPVSDVLLP
jgi:nitroreductase